MMNPPDKIELKNVSIAVGSTTILKELNWTVRAGEHWVVTGNCGSGKTILAEALGLKHRIASGTLSFPFLGKESNYDKRRAAIQMISFMDASKLFRSVNDMHYYQQRYNAFDSDGFLTVRQYLEDGGFDIDQHHNLLLTIGIDDLLDLERIKLSSGQTRKMMLAKVMLHRPKILILDNPYLGLDSGSRQTLNDLLDGLVAQTGVTIILCGHHHELPSCISHRFHFHVNGTVEKGKLQGFSLTGKSINIKQKALESIKAHFQNNNHSKKFTDVIYMEKVSIQYSGKRILNNIYWNVKQGEKWAVIGQNGSGKSTLLSLIYADNPQAYANKIFLFDKRRGGGESIWQVKKRIGFTSPEFHAYFHENFTAREVVLTGLSDAFLMLRKPTEDQFNITELLFEYFGLEAEMNVGFNSLSTGIQRLLLLMRALVKTPPLLLLDEPFQGMDTTMIYQCKHLIENVLNDYHTMIFISHFKDEIPACATHELAL